MRAFALSLSVCTLTYTCHSARSERTVKAMIISLLVVMIAVQLISKRGLWESQSRVIPSWHFSSGWPPFLKTIISQTGGYEGLSMSSAILDPLTFQFTLWRAVVQSFWYDLSVAHVLLWCWVRVLSVCREEICEICVFEATNNLSSPLGPRKRLSLALELFIVALQTFLSFLSCHCQTFTKLLCCFIDINS